MKKTFSMLVMLASVSAQAQPSVEEAWSNASSKIKGRFQNADGLQSLLNSTFENMHKQKKIHLYQTLSDANSNSLYRIEDDQIQLLSSLDQEQLTQSLFHEVNHAYQMRYRLPFDLLVLGAKGDIDENIAVLDAFYEMQANWQTLTLRENKAWELYWYKINPYAQLNERLFYQAPTYNLQLAEPKYKKTELDFSGLNSDAIYEQLRHNGNRDPHPLMFTDILTGAATSINLHHVYQYHQHFVNRINDSYQFSTEQSQRMMRLIPKFQEKFSPVLIKASQLKFNEKTVACNFLHEHNNLNPIQIWLKLNYTEFQNCELFYNSLSEVEFNEAKKLLDFYYVKLINKSHKPDSRGSFPDSRGTFPDSRGSFPEKRTLPIREVTP